MSFVAEELKAIFDPQGGQWIAGQYVPSLLAAIGGIIDTHLATIETADGARQPVTMSAAQPQSSSASINATQGAVHRLAQPAPKLCPRCSQPGYRMEGSCRVCLNCGHSSCG